MVINTIILSLVADNILLADIDECQFLGYNDAPIHDCDSNATCVNTIGSFMCTCKEGYTGNGKQCEGLF